LARGLDNGSVTALASSAPSSLGQHRASPSDRDLDTVAFYEVGHGPALVLVHGIGEDHRAWRRALPSLVLGRRVILVDLRGHGNSSIGDEAGTLQQFGDDLDRVLGALGVERAAVAGFSFGGLVAARCAIDHPDRIAALAMISTSPEVGPAAAEWYLHRARLGLARDEALRAVLRQDTKALFRRGRDREEGLRIRMEATSDMRGFGNACAALAALHSTPITPDLGRIAVPTCVVVGADDHHSDERMRRILVESISAATLCSIPQAGYAVPVERGPQLGAALLAWLASVEL
jgi:pimeloyl-ACP methyl ester carboxylesterase